MLLGSPRAFFASWMHPDGATNTCHKFLTQAARRKLIDRRNGFRKAAFRCIRDMGVIVTDEAEQKKIEENDQGYG